MSTHRTGPVPERPNHKKSRTNDLSLEEYLALGDVEICFHAEGSIVKAHSGVLMGVSEVLREMLHSTAGPKTLRVDDDPIAWNVVINQIHSKVCCTAVPSMTLSEAFTVLPVAHKYDMKPLIGSCIDVLRSTVTLHLQDIFGHPSLFQWLELSDKLEIPDLTAACMQLLEQKSVLSRISAGLALYPEQIVHLPQAALSKLFSALNKVCISVVPEFKTPSTAHPQTVRRWCTGSDSDVQPRSCCLLGNLVLCACVGNAEQSIPIWDYQTQSLVGRLDGHTQRVYSVTTNRFGINGMALSASADCSIRLWDVKKQECKAVMTDGESQQYHVCFAGEGRAISSSGDRIKVWDLDTCTQLMGDLVGHRMPVSCLATGANSQLVASGSEDCSVRLWDSRIGQCVREMEQQGDPMEMPEVESLATDSAIYTILAGYADGSVRSWDVGTGRCIATFSSHVDSAIVAMNSQGTAALSMCTGQQGKMSTLDLTKGCSTGIVQLAEQTLNMCADLDLSTVAVLSNDFTQLHDDSDPVKYYMEVWGV